MTVERTNGNRDADEPDYTKPNDHALAPEPVAVLGEELREDVALDGGMLANAIGGWRGIIDSSLPSLAFIIVYLVSSQNLTLSIWVALGAGALIAILRLIRRQSIQQVLGGFGGVALSAWFASRSGNAIDFFLPTLLFNSAYALAFIASNLVRWPLVGVAVGAATGDLAGWRKDRDLYRAYRLATWVWAGMFIVKLIILMPMYWLELVGLLGISKIVLGWPLMLLVGLWTYRIIRPPLAAAHEREKARQATSEESEDSDDRSNEE